MPRGTQFGPPIEGPDLQDVLDAISAVRADMNLLLQELKKIAKLVHDLPIDLERRE
jgi:hypothetical protein